MRGFKVRFKIFRWLEVCNARTVFSRTKDADLFQRKETFKILQRGIVENRLR